jgi:outer membrane protein assembly factor BamB
MADRSRNRGMLERRRRRRRRLLPLVGSVVLVCGALLAVYSLRTSDADTAAGSDAGTTQGSTAGTSSSGGGSTTAPAKQVLRVTRLTRLAAPVQDAAVTTVGNRAYAFGGLDASGSSTATISVLQGSSVHTAGRLPVAIHDAAAAASPAGRLYVMGGGQITSASGIATFDPASRATHLVGALPTPLSDLAVATVSGITYAVGGYTGAQWSDHIYAVNGGHVRSAGRLPVGLRYAAVAALSGNVIIAGGRTESGPSRAVYRFAPATGKVTRIGTLPQGLMHASAGTLSGVMYVVGGIGRNGAAVDSLLAVTADGKVHRAATLPTPLSDAGVASLPGRIVVIGGTSGAGPTRTVLQISMGSARPAKPHAKPAAATPSMFSGPLPGDLLIADRGNNRILLVNPQHKLLWHYPSRSGQRKLFFDDDTFFVPGGRAIISNQEENHQIVMISYPRGKLIWNYGHPGVKGSGPGYLNTPDDAYKLSNGMVIVADAYNCRVLEIRGHRIVRSIGQAGHCVHDPPRYLGAVNGDTPLPDGHILVSEINGSYLDEFTLSGKLVRVYHAPVSYPSDPQLTLKGNILLADYTSPGGLVILDRRSGRVLWQYRVSSGPGRLDHPSLAAMLPNGMIAVNDDYNHRVVIIDPRTKRIVWHYGHRGTSGTAHDYLNTPDGFDFVPVTPAGKPDPAAITHGQ